MASVKETFENHPVVFGCALVITGFIAGYKVYPELHPKQQKPVVKIEKVREVVSCEVIGFETLEKHHHSRLSVLQNQLMSLESDAADKKNAFYKYEYSEAAQRVREDIKVQINNYEKSLSTLNATCKTEVS